MSRINSFSYEQTLILRKAVDAVLKQIDDAHSEPRRQEVASVVVSVANENEFDDADELVALALEEIGVRSRKTS